MALMRVTSPHTHNRQTTGQVMQLVLLATLPGVLALTFVFGWGTLVNILLAVVFAIALEASALKLRKRPVKFYLNDYTAIVTAVLLAISLPPYSSWWVILVGIFFSIIVAKQLYGGWATTLLTLPWSVMWHYYFISRGNDRLAAPFI